MKVYDRKIKYIEAMQVTPENLEIVEVWSNGSIKGTKLPREQRCIDIQTYFGEQSANVGDWIIKESPYFLVYPEKLFNKLFTKRD